VFDAVGGRSLAATLLQRLQQPFEELRLVTYRCHYSQIADCFRTAHALCLLTQAGTRCLPATQDAQMRTERQEGAGRVTLNDEDRAIAVTAVITGHYIRN